MLSKVLLILKLTSKINCNHSVRCNTTLSSDQTKYEGRKGKHIKILLLSDILNYWLSYTPLKIHPDIC